MSQTVDRALSILIDLGTGPKSLDQVAALLGVHKSTALRLLQTLEAQGFARHDEQHRYRLGPRLFALAHQALDDLDIRRLAAPHLAALNQTHGHTVHLAAYLDGAVVYIDKYDSRHPVRMGSRIGATAPVHCTAVGKVLLAALPAARRPAAVERIEFTKYTPHTITDPARFLAELDRVAASISVPEPALDYRGVLALLPDLRSAVRAASAELGWSIPSPRENPTSLNSQINEDSPTNPHIQINQEN